MSATYNTIEPTVIDEELTRKAVNEQATGDAADIARKEGIDPLEVQCLRLDYKNILKIDNVWSFENLTKLQLDNNIIERIENIHFLKNLTWLDLSFNNITTIEGLEGLTKLTDLTLFNNRITRLEGMDDLVHLTVFSIGNNCLATLDNLAYLTRFNELRLLNASGNPLCKSADYRHYILAHIRNLKYLDYRLVDEESVKLAKERYIDDLIAMEEEDKIAMAKQEADQKAAEIEAINEAAHIGGIDTLFDEMFAKDHDFQRLYLICPEAIDDLRNDYRKRFNVITSELKTYVLQQQSLRDEEVEMFQRSTSEAKADSDRECIEKLEAFYHEKKMLLRTVQSSRDSKEVDETLHQLKAITSRLSDDLMTAEMQLVEQFEDVIKEVERNYNDMCATTNEHAQNSFARYRELENEYHEKLTEVILYSFDKFAKADQEDVDDALRDVLSDKDALMNILNGTHDAHLSRYDAQEDLLVTGIAKDQEALTARLHRDEGQRNRERVCEIIALVERCNMEIEQAEENAY